MNRKLRSFMSEFYIEKRAAKHESFDYSREVTELKIRNVHLR